MHDPSNIAEQLDQLAAEFVQRHKDGLLPKVSDYIDQYPSLAKEIEQLFPTLLIFEKLKPTAEELEDRPPPVRETDGLPKISAYRILREIGRGGMGVVYEAEQLALGRRVALKVLPPGNATDLAAVERFELEARAAAGLHHSNIVPVFDVGREGDCCYYAMQFIDGEGLDQVIDELKRMRNGDSVDAVSDVTRALSGRPEEWPQSGIKSREASEVRAESDKDTKPIAKNGSTATSINKRRQYSRKIASIGKQAAEAIDHAHSRKVIHRDIKPSNLLLDQNSDVWVVDFGLAKLVDNDITQTGNILGTLRYMSPERFDGSCDERGDIYSLGATLYELLALEPLFSGSDHLSVMQAIKSTDPRPLGSIDPTIPIDLQTIIHKSLEKESLRRYRSARAMSDDLGRFLDGRPIRARRVGLLERYWLWAKGNQRLAASLATVALLLIAGLIGSTIAAWFFRDMAGQNQLLAEQKEVQKQVAENQRDEARLNAYYADMQLAQQDWNNGQLKRMLRTLQRYVPDRPQEDVRNWEWFYLLSLAHQEEHTFYGHQAEVFAVRWLPGGNGLISASADDTLRIWNVTGDERRSISVPGLTDFALGPRGQVVATASRDNVLRYWNIASGELLRTFRSPLAGISHLDWSRAGDQIVLVSTNSEEQAIVINSATNEVVFRVPQPSVYSARLSPDGRYLAAFTSNQNRIWNLGTGEIVNQLAASGNEDSQLQTFDWHPDGKRFVTGSYQSGGRLYEIDDKSQFAKLTARFDENASIQHARFSADGSQIAVCSRSQIVTIYDTETLAIGRSLKGHIGWVSSCDWDPTSNVLASSSLDGTIKTWGIRAPNPAPDAEATWKFNRTYKQGIQTGQSPEKRVEWKWDIKARQLVVQESRSGKKLFHVDEVAHFGPKPIVTFIPQSNTLIVKVFPNDLAIWDTSDWTEKPKLLVNVTGTSGAPPHAWNDNFLVASNGDGHIQLVDLKTKTSRRLRAHDTKCMVNISPNQPIMASASYGEVKLWDCQSGKEIASLYGHHPARYNSFLAAGAGGLFATTGWDQSICIWSAESRQLVRILKGHQSVPDQLYFSGDGSRLMSRGKNVKIWDVVSGRELLSFPRSSSLPRVDEFQGLASSAANRLNHEALQFESLRQLERMATRDDSIRIFRHESLAQRAIQILFSNDLTPHELTRALALAKEAVELAPTNVHHRVVLAHALSRNGLHADAATNLKFAIDSDPDDIRTMLVGIIVESQLRNQELASQKLDEVVRLLSESELTNDANSNEIAMLLNEASLCALKSNVDSQDEVTVTTLQDELNAVSNGKLSLREALLMVRPGGSIQFSVEGVVKLRLGPLFIDKPLSLRGPGSRKLVIDAGGQSRIMFINDRDSSLYSQVNISRLHLTNGVAPIFGGYDDLGNRGGGIFSRETLNLQEIILDKNQAQRGGAIWVDDGSTTSLTNCTIKDNTCSNAGGGVCICGSRWGRAATLKVEDTTFTNNTVGLVGGAIYSYGRLFMNNSTVHANEATGANRGNQWVGGGITSHRLSMEFVLTHCTITDNLGGGVGRNGHYSDGDTGEIIKLKFYAPATIKNCIVFGNTKQGKVVDIAPAYHRNSTEIAEVAHCLYGSAEGVIDLGNNLPGIDPKLHPLADNGGGSLTRLPQADSPVVDAGSETAPPNNAAFDQRGDPFKRIVGGRSDIGSVECCRTK